MYFRSAIKQLEIWKSRQQRKPLIVNGARQVGKTSLVKSFGKDSFSQVHYFNFEIEDALHTLFQESLIPAEIIKKLSLHRGLKINLDSDLLIFDEIQSCPRALNSLKYFAEDLPKQAVIAAGSLLGLSLSSEPYPVGKVEEINLYPLSFIEFLMALGRQDLVEELEQARIQFVISTSLHNLLFNLWKEYLIVGGLPEIVSIYCQHAGDAYEKVLNVRERQLELVSSYVKDMAKHSGKSNALHLERIFKSIPAQLAKVIDDSVRRFRFSGVVPGISQYSSLASAFSWLAAAGLIYKVPEIHGAAQPLSQHTKESIFKLYLFDCGILGAIGAIPAKLFYDFKTDCYKGFVAENFVIQALTCFNTRNIYGWREGEAKVEFIWQSERGVVPIEVKSGQVRQAKSLGVFMRKYDPFKAVIFGATIPRRDKNILRLPIYTAGFWDLEKF